MSTWWETLAPRERLLIVTAGVLTALVVLWQFILVPSLSANAEARARLADADRSVARLQEAYGLQRALGSASATNARPTSANLDEFKAAVTDAAGQRGLAIARLQGNDTTSVRLIFEDADPRLVFLWLEDVQANYSGQVTRFNMEQAGGRAVRVSVDLVPGGL